MMKSLFFSFFLFLLTILTAFSYQPKHLLQFKTSNGHVIKVTRGVILYDSKEVFKIDYDDDILYNDENNQLIEDHGSVFLFVAMAGQPNLDRLYAFLITPTKARLVADAILSPVKDYDGDGYLEFGGSDLTEVYPNPDSMYYIPTAYYEIRNGQIIPDYKLSRIKDIAINGRYLPPAKQKDNDGNCCTVIPTPGKKHSSSPVVHSDLLIKSFMSSDTITVFAARNILDHLADINFVVHNNKGVWYFYSDGNDYQPGTPMEKVRLADLIKVDKTVLLLSWVEKGWFAERSSKTAPWGFNWLGNRK